MILCNTMCCAHSLTQPNKHIHFYLLVKSISKFSTFYFQPPEMYFCGFHGQGLLEKKIRDHIASYGKFNHIKIDMINGYGFVQYKELAAYKRAMNSGRVDGDITYHMVSGVEIQCKNAADGKQKVGSVSLSGHVYLTHHTHTSKFSHLQ